ncbi:MAG: WD40 repeat domain-containing protein [Candidatus Woesebacteria bacterium]|jgi:WD40 repeat protein
MKQKNFVLIIAVFLVSGLIALFVPIKLSAEYKSDIPSGQNIPKLPVTSNDPKLINGHVYPNWGPVCQRYSYSVIYQDEQGRAPEYVKIYFNGEMIDMDAVPSKDLLTKEDYQKGVKYEYKYVPTKLGSNFYFFEASNGLGKTRSNIIDSPDNGPVLFKSAFKKNEVAVIDAEKQTKIFSYDLEDEWVGGVALSDDGKYLAVKTHKKIYLFDTSKADEAVWTYQAVAETPGDVKGGVDISGDGSRIIASIGGRAILFNNTSDKPLWVYKGSGNQAYNVAISKNGKYMAMGTAGQVTSTVEGYNSSQDTNLLIFWSEESEKPLWQYHTEGNFHDVSLSDNGGFLVAATGCPDRRFYLFSKSSNQPIIRSEMLTRDSPVHRAKISADGQYAAVGTESNDGAVFLFSRDSSTPVWKYPMPDRSSARALSFTSNGSYIGAATFKGDVFIFSRNTSTPLAHWKKNASFGGIDIAEDGSFVATGGTDNQLYVFYRESSKEYSISFDEYVEEVDISANGKYIAAGTGGSVYFFEAFDIGTLDQKIECREIIEPPDESTVFNIENNIENSPINYLSSQVIQRTALPGMLFGFVFLASLLILLAYLIKQKIQPQAKLNQKTVIIISTVGLIALLLTIISMLLNTKDSPEIQEMRNDFSPSLSTKAECGNNICEPDFGETKANCPKDCIN